MFRQSVVISVLLASRTVAQNSSAPTTTAWSASNTISGPNVTATATSKDISIEELWDKYVGPVQVASITTTVSPTPIASAELVPPPPLFFSPLGATPQVPAAVTNSSWKFPSGFWWGVASAAYQVEGAAKTDGRGPSIWDVLLHSVPGFGTANQTGDVADNHYYLYKQGQRCDSIRLMGRLTKRRHCSHRGAWRQGIFVLNFLVSSLSLWPRTTE